MSATDATLYATVLTTLRRRCPPPLVQQATRLVQANTVFILRDSPDELVLAVRVPGWSVAPTVVLCPETVEWACDCGSNADPCVHAAAAGLALSEAQREGKSLPAATVTRAHVRWSLRTQPGATALRLEREVRGPDDAPIAMTGPLLDGSSLPEGCTLDATPADLALDRRVDRSGHAVLTGSENELLSWLVLLAEVPSLTLDDAAVRASAEPLRPHGVVLERDGDFVLRLEVPATLTRHVVRGLALVGDTLRALVGTQWKQLPTEQRVPFAAAGTLLLRLETLAPQLTLEVRTKRFPRLVRGVPPRVSMDLVHLPHALTVVPRIVYGDPPQLRVDGESTEYLRGDLPVRDRPAEVDLAHKLRAELNLVPGQQARFEGHAVLDFAHRLQRWAADDDERSSLFGTTPLEPQLLVEGTHFDVSFTLPQEEEPPDTPPRRADPRAVMQAWSNGLDIVALDDGGWAPLPTDWLRRFGARVADLLAARRDEDKEVATCALPELARLCKELDRPAPPEFARLAAILDDFDSLPEPTLPPDLTATLRPYQARGVAWLSFLRDAGLGAVLADDMGLGKTLQALCALRGRTLVVCPRSVVHNWASELARFRPGLRCAVYEGPERVLDEGVDVTLTTYALLRLDSEVLSAVSWDTILLDEAQALKNPEAQVSRAAYQLRGAFRVALSGTPVENRLEELWSLLHFTNRGLLGGRSDFNDRYAEPIASGDRTAAARLRTRLKPFILRRMKREVAPELPARTDTVLFCELDEGERAVYDAVRAAANRELTAALGEESNTLAALEALLRLRQAACHSGLVPGQRAERSSKVERLVEALEDAAADGHKALVFSQWTSLLDRVEGPLREAGISFTRLDGSTRDRGSVVSDFQREGGPTVLLVSLKAGGTGLNLTAADHVFLLDPWWNPAIEDQAADRAHRIGQQRPVTVYRMVTRDTVDERVLALQGRKRALAEAALGELDPAMALTRDELRALLT